MASPSKRLQPRDLEEMGWDMARLLQDLAVAKKQYRPKSKGLSPAEKEYLCSLITASTSSEIREQLGQHYVGELSKGLYNYIEELFKQRPADWRDIRRWLEPEYRRSIQSPPEGSDQGKELQREPQTTSLSKVSRCDLSQTPELERFHGRITELTHLKQMIGDNCKILTILGMGGIGKTALAAVLVEEIAEQFDYVIWRDLRNMPLFEKISEDLLLFFAEQPISLPEEIERRLSLTMNYLREKRCLIILDNAESILGHPESSTTYYRSDCTGYGQLIRRIAEERHNSCLILTSRERFRDLSLLEGKKIRSFTLAGLFNKDGQEILSRWNLSATSDENWELIINHYAGNPLALGIVAAGIRDILGGDTTRFIELLQQGSYSFLDITDLLRRHFARISNLEQEVMYWLAIAREPITFEELQTDLLTTQSKSQLFNTLNSLQGRSLIQKTVETKFTQQPVIMEYVTNRLIEEICREITVQSPQLLNQFCLIKAQAEDYIRTTQTRLILEPIAERLKTIFANDNDRELEQILFSLKSQFHNRLGYFGGNLLNLLVELQIELNGRDFSNLTIWQAYLQGQTLKNTLFVNSDLGHSIFTETFGTIFCVAFSSDNRSLASGDANGNLDIWEVATGRQLATCKGHTNRIWSVKFSPDSSTLASASSDCTVKIWNLDGQCLHNLVGHSHRVWDVAFSPDGKLLASAGGDGQIRLWNALTGEPLFMLDASSEGIRTLAFSPKANILATGGEDKTVRLWNVETRQCVRTFDAHNASIRQLTFKLDQSLLATCSEDQTIKLWNWETGKIHKTLPSQSSQVWSIEFVPETNTLISGEQNGTIKLWDIATAKCTKMIEGKIAAGIQSITISPDGNAFAKGGNDQTIQIWQIQNGECLRTLRGYTNWILSVAFSPDRNTIVTGSNDQTVRLWNLQTGTCFRTLKGHISPVQIALFNPDGASIASGSDLGVVKLWSVHTGQLIKTMHEHTAPIWNMAFSLDGKKLVSCSSDRTARIWNTSTGECLYTLPHTAQVWSACFSPDLCTVATATDDGQIKFWNIHTGELIRTIQAHRGQIWAVRFRENGRLLISGSQDGTVKSWSVSTGTLVKSISCETQIWSVDFSSDGQLIAGDKGAVDVQLWSNNSGQCVKTLTGHSSWIWSVVFCPNSEFLASTAQDETVRLWDIKTGNCFRILRIERPYENMNITGVKGLTEAQRSTLEALGAVEIL